MKTLCAALVALMSLGLNVSALSFQGSFIVTVTQITTPAFGLDSLGDTFDGTYSYESAIVNGTFRPNAGNFKVTFNLPNGTKLTEADDSLFLTFPTLTVSGGCVIGFNYAFDPAGERDLFSNAYIWTSANPATVDMSGTISFSDPIQQPVPDAGSAASLLGLACLGLLSAHRWLGTA